MSPRAGGFKDREPLLFPPVEDGPVKISVTKSATGSMQVDVYGLDHGHVRFISRLPVIAVDEIEMRVVWSTTDVKLFVDGRLIDEWSVPGRQRQ